MHFYAGVIVGPFLLVAALSGLLYVFTPQLEQLVYDKELHVPVSGTAQSVEAQVAAARQALPDATVVRVRPGATVSDSTQVIFTRPDLAESHWLTAYVDPYSGSVRGILETYGSSQATPVRTWIDELHRNLHLGDLGRLYSEMAASWLWVVVLGGVVLWWRRQRAKGRMFIVDRRVRGRRGLLSWHGVTGTWIAVVLLFLSATGLTWSQYAGESIDDLRSALSWETPALKSGLPEHSEHSGHTPTGAPARDVGPDGVLGVARQAGLDGPVEVTLPAAGKAYVVKQIKTSYPEKLDSMAIDPATGEILETLRFADYPLGAKLTRWGIDAHMGLLFGLANQIVLALVCIGLLAVIIWGYRMWWHRRPTRDRFGVGRPFPRGAWRSVPPVSGVVLFVIAVAAVWFLPVFGVSLLVFLAVDAFLGWRARYH
jgi:uncharacterized iron-regulated membrane protein